MRPHVSELALRIGAALMGLPAQGEDYTAVRRCARKKAYATEREAERDQRFIRQERGWKLEAYWCSGCGGWHLGSEKAP